MATVAQTPVRHGTCRLTLLIDTGSQATHYRVARVGGTGNRLKTWKLRATDGPRAGAAYHVSNNNIVII